MKYRLLKFSLLSIMLMLFGGTSYAGGDFKDFAVIVNNQEGTLLTADEQVQGTAVSFGVAVADNGTVSRVAADDASAVATISGKYHNDHGCTNLKVVVPNVTNVKINVGQCTYSTSPITVSNQQGEMRAQITPNNPACWKNDPKNVDKIYYMGDVTTLVITGMSYCPYISVTKLTDAEIAALNSNYTLTYYNVDGTAIGTQQVKGQQAIGAFKYGEKDVFVAEGKAFRGWSTSAGKKAHVTDKVESDMMLFAVVTPIEVADNKSSYTYDLADADFDPADHECIEIVGNKAYWHDASHGWAFVNGEQIKLKVGGDATITLVNCQYGNGTSIAVKNAEGETLGSLPGKSDSDGETATFEYKGGPTTLSLVMESSGEMYIHSVAIANHSKEVIPDVVATWSWKDGIPASIADVNIEGKEGRVDSDVEGIKLVVDATKGKLKSNGDNVQFNTGTVIRVPVISSNDIVTVVAHPYNFQDIKIDDKIFTTETTVYKATAINAFDGYVEIESTNSPYLYSISVVQKAQVPLVTLTDEPVTATFAFNAGTDDQKADFGEGKKYFVTSKVTYGSNLVLKDANSGQTRFDPITQQNEPSGGTAADETNAIRFLIQPNFGFTFTPKKVSFKTTRFGTDNGLIDVSWQNPDKSAVSLAIGVKPNRNDGTNPAIAEEVGQTVSNLSYDIEGATPAEGTCGLLINLYHLQTGKQIGFSDIVIEGTLSGTEKEVPVLATVGINGLDYAAEFIFEDGYEGQMELSKKEPMIGESNPVTPVAKQGEIGTVTYAGDDTKCVVTIPMTQGGTTVDYVLTLVQKPDYKLSYIDTDKKTVLGEFVREKDETIGQFDVDYATATAPEGMKVRGWFTKTAGGVKYTADDVVTGNVNLYAVATEIEEPSTHKKYTFDLTDKLFDAADHEAFNPSGDKFYWHDPQHGWAFSGSNKIDLLVGPKATVSVTLCRYGKADDIIITDAKGQQIGTIPGINNEETDGEIVAFNYEGEPGTITLNLNSSGEMYIHAVKIVNTAETNYDSQGNWYFVKAGDANSLIEVLDIVNGKNASKDAERSIIFLPNGTYDLGETVKTAISGHNISIVGQSMDKTIIVTAPDKSIEGLGSADMLKNSGTNLYLQDLTLKNALDYYGALGGGQVGGRAAVLQDAGNRTIGKNVRMLSYQDTYYSSNASQQAYWEDCDIHGTVDFICGGGDIRFQNTTISLEPRNADGTGGRTVTAPTTNTTFGYVFDNCKVVDLAQGKGNWNFGRTWQNTPICVWLNTTLDNHAQKTLVSTRWTEKGMNSKDPKLFGEYGTKDANGTDITPASNKINSHGGTFETIISAEQAANYSYDMMFKENLNKKWDPAGDAKQINATVLNPVYNDGSIYFEELDNGMRGCAIFKNGEFVAVSATGYSLTIDPDKDELTVRGINRMGGFGPEAHVKGTAGTGIAPTPVTQHSAPAIYNLKGQRVQKAGKGLYIVNGKKVIR